MTEQELRALVREAIKRHVGASSPLVGASSPLVGARVFHAGARAPLHLHPSHSLFPLSDGSTSDGPCLIEPAVACNHCGYCKSYGH
jgi:hypothetical protein